MNDKIGQDLDSFRAKIVEFPDKEVTDNIREAGRKMTGVFPSFYEAMAFHRLLRGKGWSAIGWPVKYGGTGWNKAQQLISNTVGSLFYSLTGSAWWTRRL